MTFHSSSSSASMRAYAPFDTKDANLVLRSSDNVEFRVHKHVVSLASPVLAALISILPKPPSPPAVATAARRHRKRPFVELAESSEILDMFLRFIYPLPEPPLTLDDIATLLKLARKYDSESVASRMRVHLLRPEHLAADPLAVYTLASFAEMDDVAGVAARHTLSHPFPPAAQLTEMGMGQALVRLVEYRRRCLNAARAVAWIADGSGAAVPWWVQLQWRRFCFLSECGYECAGQPRRALKWDKTVSGRVEVPEYWVEYMGAVCAALGEKLDPDVARDARLVRPAVEKAMRCTRCAGKAFWDLEEFSKILADAVEEAVSKVKFVSSKPGDYEEKKAPLLSAKTNYLLPCNKIVWPVFDYSFNLYCRKLDLPFEEDATSAIDDDLTVAPPSEC